MGPKGWLLAWESSSIGSAPHIVVVALFAKAGSNSGAFFLDDGTLVGNRLRGAHITDELFHYRRTELVRWNRAERERACVCVSESARKREEQEERR